ncbi:flagellar basal-body MS-ring/collar protein FliF [Pseudorhodoplanes sp.]|uniref:flagellar basal-body MS-ring/collar protein FliF n=1 Tax=Pseudorhodoplanes sp. TaxID=1934341 RepID=UPI003D14079C
MISKQRFEHIGAGLLKLGARRLAVLGVVGGVVMACVGLAATYLSRPVMQPIYTGLSSQDVARIAESLAEAGVPFDVNEQRSTVLVPFGQAVRARTLLAQKGLPTSSRAGYEVFDQLGSMGLTSFMQEVTRVRALEGEIARTIQALDGVMAARVHLVLPDTGSFRRERREPSASVLLRLDAQWQARAGQVVRHLVAAAVPGMKIEQVSVASTDGRLIASGGDDKSVATVKLNELERSMAAELEQWAGRTLASIIGSGNFQISATVRLDVDRKQTNETLFDPKSRVERSIRVVKQSGSSEDAASKAASGVEANVPREETAQSDGDKRRQREDRREELINYELNSKTVQTVREGYRVRRIAIAVVVNRKELLGNNGSDADQAATASRLAELKKLIMAATGANQDDSIEVSAAEFSPDAALVPIPAASLYDYVLMNLGTMINSVAILAVVAIILAFGIRPIMTVIGQTTQSVQQELQSQIAADGPAAISIGTDSPKGITQHLATDALPNESMAEPIPSLAQARDADVRARLEALVSADDARVAKVLKNWMSEARQS